MKFNLDTINICNNIFIKVSLDKTNFIFSTAENNLDFNKNSEIGQDNLAKLKNWFSVEKVGYLSQIHSNNIYEYKNQICDNLEGDAIISNKKSVAIGIFTADCVPILLYDKKNKAIAAIHSGWRGTYNHITMDTIDRLNKEYNTKAEDIIAIIGPHISKCCYEVSESLISKFKNDNLYNDFIIDDGNRNLDLSQCIIAQLLNKKVSNENILDLNMCTYCNEDYRFHSYRKDQNTGRQFSFVYISE
ncbi:peptidoglycan editing factor PgeF [Clostridium oceanicum]|uniref:Purine nucleoside phosphorylase n=1 Tax=Clostridium oceanicum TaxID=1543 RepID=A0ABP3ULA9_9CLOT